MSKDQNQAPASSPLHRESESKPPQVREQDDRDLDQRPKQRDPSDLTKQVTDNDLYK